MPGSECIDCGDLGRAQLWPVQHERAKRWPQTGSEGQPTVLRV